MVTLAALAGPVGATLAVGRLRCWVAGERLVLHAVLERTAVVGPGSGLDGRRLVRLDEVRVSEREVEWLPVRRGFRPHWEVARDRNRRQAKVARGVAE